jgi:hypothetical protein
VRDQLGLAIIFGLQKAEVVRLPVPDWHGSVRYYEYTPHGDAIPCDASRSRQQAARHDSHRDNRSVHIETTAR